MTAAETLGVVEELCRRHGIVALDDFVESCGAFARDDTLNIAVLGRFKAGKSSFLNHLLGRPLLPVGVIPVTSVVTEIEWGAHEWAEVVFADGRREATPAERIGDYISEERNPGNSKGVARVCVELPAMERYRGIRFVDTPGLDSVFEHNSDAALDWLPNVGLALIAVGVDPPLSRHDIELIRNLSRYTPNISLLLTKVDLLDEGERVQVREFIAKELARYWNGAVLVYPYSVRPGFEDLRTELEQSLMSRAGAGAGAGEQRATILRHKLDSLASECAGYLNLALKAAETADCEREDLRRKILGQKESLDDTRLGLKLIVRHAAGMTRPSFEALLRPDEAPVRARLQADLARQFPAWSRSLSFATEKFDEWMSAGLTREMAELSKTHRSEFVEPARRAGRRLSQSIQDFRNRLSERMLEALGVPLRTTESELRTEDPQSPDVRVGRIFDHNWELLSWVIPMTLARGAMRKHYQRKVEDLVFTNLSRLASQWAEIADAALLALEKESLRRLDGLIGTIEKLIASARQQAPEIREDIERLEALRRRLARGSAPAD
jgi:GTP-binding protein EngB required for normal cell division